ncbi:MAG: hypothetical protein AAF939_04320 [Planctomycetota bacterium]
MKFSIFTILGFTTLVAIHLGVPFLGQALMATLIAAVLLNFVSMMPLAGLTFLFKKMRGDPTPISLEIQQSVSRLIFAILAAVYLVVATLGLAGIL